MIYVICFFIVFLGIGLIYILKKRKENKKRIINNFNNNYELFYRTNTQEGLILKSQGWKFEDYCFKKLNKIIPIKFVK